MNSNIFSGKRLSEFMPVELICLRKRLLLYSFVMAGILTVIALINAMGQSYTYARGEYGYDPALPELVVLYLVMMFFFGCVSASVMWWEMKDKQGRIYILMNPATVFEKFIVKFFIYVVCFLLVYFISVCFAETVRYLVFDNIYPDAGVRPLYLSFSYPKEIVEEIWGKNSRIEHPLGFFFCLYLMFQSFFVLGSSIWPSRAFIKTFLVFGCLTAVYIFIAARTTVELAEGKTGDPIWFRDHIYTVYYIFTTTVTLINWTLAYFRIKETDVITTKR